MLRAIAAFLFLGMTSSLYAGQLKLEVQCGHMPNGEVSGVFVNQSYYFSFALPQDLEVNSYCEMIKNKTKVLNVVSDKPVEITFCSNYYWDRGMARITKYFVAIDGTSEYAGDTFLPMSSLENCLDKTSLRYL